MSVRRIVLDRIREFLGSTDDDEDESAEVEEIRIVDESEFCECFFCGSVARTVTVPTGPGTTIEICSDCMRTDQIDSRTSAGDQE